MTFRLRVDREDFALAFGLAFGNYFASRMDGPMSVPAIVVGFVAYILVSGMLNGVSDWRKRRREPSPLPYD